jgi:putative transposase
MRQDGNPPRADEHPGATRVKMGTHWKNYYTDGCVHHVTFTVHRWQKALLFPGVLELMYIELEYAIHRWDISILGYVIMPEHFHGLFFGDNGLRVQKALHGIRRSISGAVRETIESGNPEFRAFCRTNGINERLFYTGTGGKSIFRFWKEKPRIFPLSFEEAMAKKLDYIHNNPVRRGLVASMDEWEHSSARAYLHGETAKIPIGFQRKQGV